MKIAHVISVSGGKDSTATLILALSRVPRESIIPIFCDTGNEQEQVYHYLDALESHVGIPIQRLKADFSAEIWRKRKFIAKDQRTLRQYKKVPRMDARGKPVQRRDSAGNLVYHTAIRKGVEVQEPVYRMRKSHGRKVRWSNKAKRRALAVLYPSGNPFLDLCMWKGRFPSSKAQFCTQELKRNMAVAFQLDLVDHGYSVVSWQGIRRDESWNRRNAKKAERIGPNLWAFRPLVDWTAKQAVDYVRERGCPLNPLYTQGMSRVGCMPCINVKKAELAETAARFPQEIERIKDWEWKVSQCSKRGYSTMMCDAPHAAKDRREIFDDLRIESRVAWAQGNNGTLDLFAGLDMPSCASAYGLCE